MAEEEIWPELREILQEVAAEQGFTTPEFSMVAGANRGDSFMGVAHRVCVKESNKGEDKLPLSLFVKNIPENKFRQEYYRIPHLFKNEAVLYNKVLPELANFQKEKGILSNPSPTHPRCFRGTDEVIVLQDISPLGYIMRDRCQVLDLDHCLLVMSELGRLHAVSFALRDQKPEELWRLVNSIPEPFFVPNLHKSTVEWFSNTLLKARDKFVEHSTVGNKRLYVDSLERYEIGCYQKMLEIMDYTNAEPYAVINHGDCWTNNVLFKYNKDGKPEGLCLVDFQIGRFVSPGCDISYFLFTCTDKITRDAHYLSLLKEYHRSLAEHLKRLGSDVQKLFPFDALMEQMRRFGRFGLMMSVGLIPMFTCSSEEMPDLDAALGVQDVSADKAFEFEHSHDKQCWERVCGVVKDAVDFGFID